MFQDLIRGGATKAIQYGDVSYTYDELITLSECYARYMRSVVDGDIDKVMFFSKNSPEYIIAIYGGYRCGAVAVPVDVMSPVKEVAYVINDARPEIIYTTDDKLSLIREAVALVGDEGYSPALFTSQDVDIESSVGDVGPVLAKGADDLMAIIYTSGTTGSPKGVMLSYANLWYNVEAVAVKVEIYSAQTRLLMILPLHHSFAFAGALIAPLYVQAEVHIVETLTAECIMETMQKGRTTLMLGVPRLYEGFAKGIMSKIKSNPIALALYWLCAAVGSQSFSKRIFKSVHDKFGGEIEFFVCGGAALPIETGKIFKRLGFYILDGYGMTECGPMISFTRPGRWTIGYSGLMLPGCEQRVAESGELLVRGANVMKGYYNRPEETAQIIRDGWLHTGDTAIYDERYGMKITGRIKEIIVTASGKNINPAEIENEITQESVIIKEVAVVLQDDKLQALIYPDMSAVRADGQSTLDELVRAEIESYNRSASSYKRIMNYQIISVELPKTRLGKIQRFRLEDLLESREDAPRDDISGRSECYQLIKGYLDELTGMWANGDSHFEIDLALDSLGRVSLLAYVEEHFGVAVGEEQLNELSTLNLLSEYVESRSESTQLGDGEFSWREILESGDANVELPKSGGLHWFMHNFLITMFSLLYNFRSRGVESLPSKPVLFVANHGSGFDGGFVSSKLPWSVVHKSFFFAKEKHFKGWFKRFMARKNNVIVMDINSNVRSSVQQMYEVLKGGNNIIIFPEGTRSKSGALQSFKDSFAILSEVLGVDVVPVAIKGSNRATYESIRLPRLRTKVEVSFLETMRINEGEDAHAFAQRVRAAIEQSLLEG